MKFTDGYWMYRKGLTALHPRDISDVVASDSALEIYAPTQQIKARGDALNCPQLTVSFTSPVEGVIGVTIEHFQGALDPNPRFELQDAHPAVDVTVGDTHATLTSGALTASVSLSGDWAVDFTGDGKLLTSSVPRSVGYITDDVGRSFVHEQLTLGVGTNVYGLGKRFGAFVKNGQSVDVWNEDGGTSSDLAYKNVPFFLTNSGYGVFVNHPERVSFEIGSEVVSRAQFSVEGQKLQYFVIYGPSPKEILRRYTELTGRPARTLPGPTGCGCPRPSPRTMTGTPSCPSSMGWLSGTCRSRCSTSTATGCGRSTGATSSGIRIRSPTPRACSVACTSVA